jgi:hypothetical protein
MNTTHEGEQTMQQLQEENEKLRQELAEAKALLQRVSAFLPSTKKHPVPTHAFSASRKGTLKGVEWNWTNVCDVCGGGLEDPQHGVSQSKVGRSATKTSVSKAQVEKFMQSRLGEAAVFLVVSAEDLSTLFAAGLMRDLFH